MSKVQITIDGKPVIADTEQTILQVCREQGIDIPTLCYDDQLEPYTSCFLCVVKVEGARTFVPACGTRVAQGMNITTLDPEVESARKMALELILSNHYADCLGPCKLTCPAGVDVQGYLALAAMGKYREAIELIKQSNPLPTVCGRVCTRPCELNCRRNLVDQAAAIDHVKRFLADWDLESPDRYFPVVKPDTGHKVAIVGAGPAGLSCAYYLRIEGHQVDIFDAKPKPGGMLRWGIPEYRLPERILDKEIEGITRLGVNIYCNKALGRDFTIDSLFDQGYEAVFLGLGAQASTNMRVENEDAEGVLGGIDFLEDVKMKRITRLSGKVAVIGGGNTAMDAARTALRLGADEVTIVYRRTIKEMPANKIEIEEAQEEGVKFQFLTAPVRVITDESGRVRGLECVKMELGPPDASGRRRPIPIEGSNHVIEVDWVIAAIGQKPDFEFAGKDEKLVEIRKTRWGTLEIKPDEMETNIPGVFAGGDVVLGPATAIEAIADGHKAALAIHEYLTGERLRPVKKPFISRKDNLRPPKPEDFLDVSKIPREKMPTRDPEERKHSWDEIELGFTEEQAYQEALRCLECGCQAFYECDLQKHATEYQAVQENFLGEFHDIKPDRSHPFIQIELNKCILCGRCVRICDEVMGLGVFGFVQRGFDAKVKPVLEMPLAESHCISCGQCVETCPTGAITDRVDAEKPGPWILTKHKTLCQYCSVGCSMQADILDDRVLKISADPTATVNEFGNLCVKGRYGFHYVNDSGRLREPLIRRNGRLEKVSWSEAIEFTARRIRELQQNNAAWAVFGSPLASNEENYLLQKFARTVLKTNNVGSFANLHQIPENLLRASLSNVTFEKIEQADLALVFDFDPMESHPVLYIKLHKAARKGKKIYVLNENRTRLAEKSLGLPIPSEKMVEFLQYLIDAINHSEHFRKMLGKQPIKDYHDQFPGIHGLSRKISYSRFNLNQKQFKRFLNDLIYAKSPLFVINRESASPELIHWVNSLGAVLGHTEFLLSLPAESNFQGMLDMGIHPEYLPGYQRVDNPQVHQRFKKLWGDLPAEQGLPTWTVYQQINAHEIQGIILWGQDPVGTGELPLDRSPKSFLMVADMFLTKTAEQADVVFPLSPFMENAGTITNAEIRVQPFKPVVTPMDQRLNWEILTELSRKLGVKINYKSVRDITEEIYQVVPEYRQGLAVFRNGYEPVVESLKNVVARQVPFGASFLRKWFDSYYSTKQPRKSREELGIKMV